MFGVLERLKYINHLGEELHFGRDGLYVNESDIRDFSWTVATVNNKVSGFSRGMANKTIPVRVLCASKADGIIKKNNLFEIPEKDILANQKGRLELDGYYCECFVTGSQKSRYTISEQYMETDLTIFTDRPVWVRETKIDFKKDPTRRPDGQDDPGTVTYDFPFDFPFGLMGTVDRQDSILNDTFYDTNFRLVIHGSAVNPTVYINDHQYQVNTGVQDGADLVIDSLNQKIYLDADGVQTSAFDARGRDEYIFEPIPAGELEVRWDNTFDFDLYLLEERSEPRWRRQI